MVSKEAKENDCLEECGQGGVHLLRAACQACVDSIGAPVAYLFTAWPPKVSVLHPGGKEASVPVRVKGIFGFLIIGLEAYLEILTSAEEI